MHISKPRLTKLIRLSRSCYTWYIFLALLPSRSTQFLPFRVAALLRFMPPSSVSQCCVSGGRQAALVHRRDGHVWRGRDSKVDRRHRRQGAVGLQRGSGAFDVDMLIVADPPLSLVRYIRVPACFGSSSFQTIVCYESINELGLHVSSFGRCATRWHTILTCGVLCTRSER